jgi:hypothetical protein
MFGKGYISSESNFIDFFLAISGWVVGLAIVAVIISWWSLMSSNPERLQNSDTTAIS